MTIPEPSGKLPIVGHLLQLAQGDLYDNILRLSAENGPIFKLKIWNHTVIAVSSPEMIKEVCNDRKFDKYIGPLFLEPRHELTKDSLITSKTDEPIWGQGHRILMPGLKPQTIYQDYYPMMVDITQRLIAKWNGLPPNQEINLSNEMSHLALDIITLCGLNYRLNSFETEEPHTFIIALAATLNEMSKRSLLPKPIKWFRVKQTKEYHKNIDILYRTVDEILEDRKKNMDKYADIKDFLNMMLKDTDKVTGEKLSDTNIRHQLIMLLIGGHETTANLLAFIFSQLLTRPEILNKAYEEVDRCLGHDLTKIPTIPELLSLTYITQIANECLRLWPPILLIDRAPKEDLLLGGKYPLKKDQWIWPLYVVMQRDKTIWGEDADSFNPDRFSEANSKDRDPFTFLPFGIGQRACIGRQFAMLEVPLVIGMLLQRYRFQLRKDYQFKPVWAMTLKPSTLWVSVEKRSPTDRIEPKANGAEQMNPPPECPFHKG